MTKGPIAVIGGTGDEGFGLGSRWAVAGYRIVIGSRDAGRAKQAADRLRSVVPNADVCGAVNEEAAGMADVLMVTVPFSGQAMIYKAIAERIRPDAIVIDGTVPLAAAVGGRATHTLGVWEGSAAQHALSFLPKGTKMCAAFHSLAAIALNDVEYVFDGDVLVCGSKSGKEVVKELVEAIPKLRYIDAGPLENARIIEPLTALLIGINHRHHTDRAGLKLTGI